ncbi:hypothetical protein [Hydrocoleum sp. CS-953]|nr:hypothetical protein [Hydrocoleum sp. CS-953]
MAIRPYKSECVILRFPAGRIEPLTVSPENRSEGELIDKKWVIIDLMIG